MKKNPFVSIIIPVLEINDYIRESIPFILNLDYGNFEILILPNEDKGERFEKTKIIPTHLSDPAIKRDVGGKKAKGEILAFLDDDAYPFKNWLKKATRHFQDEKVAAVGGPGITPKNESFSKKLSGAVFESFLGGGKARERYLKVGKIKKVDDWPTVNFLIRKALFQKVGGFDTKFWPGEDTKLGIDIINLNKKIIYDPNVLVYHHRRDLLYPHLKQVYSYGVHRGYFVKKFPQTSLRPFYFFPSLFLLYLIFIPLFSILYPLSSILYFIPLYLYGLLLIFDGILASLRYKSFWLGFLLMPLIFITHLTYGIGFIRGLSTKELKK